MVKLQQYLEAKKRYQDLEKRRTELSNFIWDAENKAEKAVEPLYEKAHKARDEARLSARLKNADKVGELDIVREQLAEAQRLFSTLHYECNHRDENGNLALQFMGGFGYDPGDQLPIQCIICAQKWQPKDG